MATTKPKAPRKTLRKPDLIDQVAREVLPAIYMSAGYEILNQQDGRMATRAVHLSYEVGAAYEKAFNARGAA